MDPYASAGVDEGREQDVFATARRPWLTRTAVRSQLVTSITGLASGYFATLMHIPPGPPIALTTDGVGTKILLAREADRWEPVGIDCVANNVNDVICTGAVPLALLDYIATDRIDAAVLEAIARGLYRGADEAGIAIPGGEIAQIGAMLADSAGGGPMLDLVGTAVGAIPDGRSPVDGSAVRPGDVVLALPSSGLHSHGYSPARPLRVDPAGRTARPRRCVRSSARYRLGMDVRGYVEANASEFIDDLKQWLTIPSISADPARHGDVGHSAAWLAGHLRGAGFPVAQVLDTGGLPAVYAEWPAADPSAPVVLVYGHHDVQPVEPHQEWESPPLEPAERDGRLLGRGASDDKG